MLGSRGAYKKQRPYDESIRIPLLLHWPKRLGVKARQLDAPINSEDLMPTLLGLCSVPIPKSAEGLDYSGYIRGGKNPGGGATVILCPAPFGEWARPVGGKEIRGGKNPGDGPTVILCPAPFGEWPRRVGGKEFRGVRTARYTYVRDLSGPWLLYDNQTDPYQTNNLANQPKYSRLQGKLDATLARKLKQRHDDFLPGAA